jgi:hypothetical protein
MAKKVKTIILDENKVKEFFETIEDAALRNSIIDVLKICTVTNTKIPPLEEFIEYGYFIYRQQKRNPNDYDYALRAKYFQWVEDGWVDGYGTPIRNWKTKLANTIPKLSPMFQTTHRNTSQNLVENLIKNGLPEFK